MEGQNMEVGRCKCAHHYSVGALVALIGLLFLLGALGIVGDRVVELGWPILLLLIGLSKVTKRYCKCCSSESGKCEGGKCC